MTKDPTCEQRIDEQLRDRLNDLASIFSRIDKSDGDGYEDAIEELDNIPLSIEPVRQVRIVLSTGGPHDEFLCTLDPDGRVARVEYIFQDWFDGARRTLSDVTYEDRQTGERFCEYFTEVINWNERA